MTTTTLVRTDEGHSSDQVLTHDRVRRARTKAGNKRARVALNPYFAWDSRCRRSETHLHREGLAARAEADVSCLPDEDSPEFWFCQDATQLPIDVPATLPGCWTFGLELDQPIKIDQPPIAIRRKVPQADVDDLVIEEFGARELVSCGIEGCCSSSAAFEIFGGDPEIYAPLMGFKITDRP